MQQEFCDYSKSTAFFSTIQEDDHVRIRKLRLGTPHFGLFWGFLKLNLLDLGIIRHGNGRRYSTRAEWADAKLWVEQNGDYEMGFRWIFNAFGLDPDAAMRHIKLANCHKCKKNILTNFCRCSWHVSKKSKNKKHC